jgi:YgiT-type zinc finger domain-containing protein
MWADINRTVFACCLHHVLKGCDYYYNLCTETAQMGNAVSTEAKSMKCSIQGCPGEYEEKMIVHVVQRQEEMFLFEHVPAEVCSVCGDTLLTPHTVKQIEHLLTIRQRPEKFVPMYEFAEMQGQQTVLNR